MKLLFTSKSADLTSEIDPRFGRAAFLIVMDSDNGEWEAHPNVSVNSASGAGIQTAQFASSQGVEAVISGDFGPHAMGALKAAQIPMYLYGGCQTVEDAIAQFQAGKLEQLS
jgi:predicted Fe-Mo cluster-binding NifX family protein